MKKITYLFVLLFVSGFVYAQDDLLNMLIDEVNEMTILAVILVGFTVLVIAGFLASESVTTLG